MAQAVSLRPLNAEVQFRSQTSSCEVFVGHSGNGTGFFPSTSVSPVSNIPPMLYTHLPSTCCCYLKDKRAKPGNLPKRQSLSESGSDG